MPDHLEDPDLIALAREILSRLTPEERALAATEGERLGVSEEYVILAGLGLVAEDSEAGVAGKA